MLPNKYGRREFRIEWLLNTVRPFDGTWKMKEESDYWNISLEAISKLIAIKRSSQGTKTELRKTVKTFKLQIEIPKPLIHLTNFQLEIIASVTCYYWTIARIFHVVDIIQSFPSVMIRFGSISVIKIEYSFDWFIHQSSTKSTKPIINCSVRCDGNHQINRLKPSLSSYTQQWKHNKSQFPKTNNRTSSEYLWLNSYCNLKRSHSSSSVDLAPNVC